MSLQSLRKKVDGLDAKIVSLLNDRARLSKAIGENKKRNNQSIYSPAREKEVLNHIKTLNRGPMTSEALEAVYREVMSGSIALEKSVKIASLGKRGSFSSIATRRKFGKQINYEDCQNIPEVFRKVEVGDCDYGVVPIENSVEGAVTDTYDMLVDTELKVCAQILQPIAHNLMVAPATKTIKRIYSNLQVFGQCRGWLEKYYPNAYQVPMASTVEAAERVLSERDAAAIASVETAESYKLKILNRNIQDIAHNTTRFFVIGKEDAAPTGNDRTSIILLIKDRVGALYSILTPFSRNKINLTKIESRPSKKRAWEYYFFVDLKGHRSEKPVKKALEDVEDMCKHLKVLGSYPISE